MTRRACPLPWCGGTWEVDSGWSEIAEKFYALWWCDGPCVGSSGARHSTVSEAAAIKAAEEAWPPDGWQPIEAAPKDGTPIDIWCVPPEGSDFEPENGGVRLTAVTWHEAGDIFPHTGWTRCCDDGHWDLVEGEVEADSECLLPPWKPTHWMPLPAEPEKGGQE